MAPRLGIAYIPTRELESSRAVEREEEVSRSEESLFKVVLLPADSSNDMVMAKVERHSMVLSSMQRQNYGAVSNANFRLVQRQNHGAASRDIAPELWRCIERKFPSCTAPKSWRCISRWRKVQPTTWYIR